jgi:hypothetical protein
MASESGEFAFCPRKTIFSPSQVEVKLFLERPKQLGRLYGSSEVFKNLFSAGKVADEEFPLSRACGYG